ncbi:hypothetical protein VPH35_112819 [Triticum aestivum]
MANPSMAAGGRVPLAEGVRAVGAQIRNRIRIFVFSLLPAPTERQTSKSLSLRAGGRGWRAPHRRHRGWTSTASSTACAARRPPASSAPSRASSPPSPSTSPAPRRTTPGSRPSSRRWRRPSGGTRSGPTPPTRKSTTRSRLAGGRGRRRRGLRTRSASCSALSGPITSTYPRSSTTRLQLFAVDGSTRPDTCIGDNKKAWKTGHCRYGTEDKAYRKKKRS